MEVKIVNRGEGGGVSYTREIVKFNDFKAVFVRGENTVLQIFSFIPLIHDLTSVGGYPWYSGSARNCRSTGRASDPAPGVWVTTKFITLAQVVHGPVKPYSAEPWHKTPFISFLNSVTFDYCTQRQCGMRSFSTYVQDYEHACHVEHRLLRNGNEMKWMNARNHQKRQEDQAKL